jgi:hypothetical protein
VAVIGLDGFAKYFAGYEDCYTIIGGAACEILMSQTPIDFRATKDIDMIILFEDKFKEFAELFWNYVREGGYTYGWKNSDEPHFYRFTDPKDGYPKQIELFSRKPNYHLESTTTIVPIHIDDDVSSLSAILLNDDFYDFMLKGRTVIRGLSVLETSYIIPFKMMAWVNLMHEKSEGRHVNSKDLRKHKNDVFQLFQIVPEGETIEVTGDVADSVDEFLKMIIGENIVFADLGIDSDIGTEVRALRETYVRVQ